MRFISNRSTGVTGYKIAEEALKRKHKVTLISGPTALIPPKVNKFIPIETADDLLKTLKKQIKKANCLIMAAAVGDFKPACVYKQKIKRQRIFNIELVPNKDILLELQKYHKRKLFIGFSLETENLIKNSYLKLKNKNLNLIVANSLTKHHNPFGYNKLDVVIIDKSKKITKIKQKNKVFIAYVLLDKIEELWYEMKKTGGGLQ